MKHNSLKKLLALLMAMVMVLGLFAACGNTTEEPDDETHAVNETVDQDAADDAAQQADAGIAGWTAFEENVTLKIPVYDRGAEGVPAIGENYWETWIQENFGDKYNITVEFVPINRKDVLTSYALLAADQDLPTILMEYDYPKQAQWVSDGYLATYDLEEFAFIAPTYYQQMVDNNQLTYTQMAGETYFVLAERPYYATAYTYVTWYRQDWLKEVGYDSYPTTWAEEKEMLQALQDAGICENPLGGNMITGSGVDQNYAFRTYPLDEEHWATYGDYAIPALGSEENYKLVKRENEKYNLGLINPEYYITDSETAKANFINGKAVQYGGYIAAEMDWLTAFYETNPDADLAVKIHSTTGDEEAGTVPAYRSNNPFGMMIGFSSMASEDEIKAAMMYMEWMCQEENLFTMQWGYEGEHFEYDANGLPVGLTYEGSEHTQGYNNSKDYWCVVVEARTAGTIEDVIRTSSPVGLPEDFSQDIIANYYAQVEASKNGWAVADCMYAVNIESVGEYQATLLALYEEYRNKLTMCDPAEFDALYEEYAQLYAEAGYQEILDERLEAYQNGNTSLLPDYE